MDKSLLTNIIALIVLLCGWHWQHEAAFAIGIFALSGALTNWLAVHMLFEKIPGIYGSGIVQIKFEAFKQGIHNLVMEQFFNAENIEKFLSNADGSAHHFDLMPVIEKLDFAPAFDGLVKTVMDSQLGGMLGMLGGAAALDPLRMPFANNMKSSILDMTQSENFAENIRVAMGGGADLSDLRQQVDNIVEKRLDELTPQMVKEIIQTMIKTHLGWLVVWGGVFGGMIGLLAQYLGW
jgi:uncharacterized membrane-anchored protein YjiN (DUF445 family)